MTEYALCLQGISKAFGEGAVVLKDLWLEVKPGEIMVLLGPSGCGKTTTLRLIAGLLEPDRGQIWIAGQEVAGSRWVPPERRSVGLVFQDYALFPHLTVAGNLLFGGNQLPPKERRRRLEEMVELFHLEGLTDRYPHELSGGEQQRVALARAMMRKPRILLLDEPFSNLDAGLRAHMRSEIREILKASGSTAILVTQDQEDALFMGDRIAILHQGRIEQVDTPEEIYYHPRTSFVARFLGIADFLPAQVTEEGLVTEIGIVPQRLSVPLGTRVEVMVRPNEVIISPSGEGKGKVINCLFQGLFYIYFVLLPSGQLLHSLQPHTVRYPPGTRVEISLAPGHPLPCFVNGYSVS